MPLYEWESRLLVADDKKTAQKLIRDEWEERVGLKHIRRVRTPVKMCESGDIDNQFAMEPDDFDKEFRNEFVPEV